MYLTYQEYAGMDGGVDAAAFARLDAKAEKLVDRATHGRLKGEEPVRDAVKSCVFELIGELCREETAREMDGGRELASMSNDGLSVSFATQSAAGGASSRQMQILRQWLGDASLASLFDFTWIPRYGTNDGTLEGSVRPSYACDLWQYTSAGKIDGISGNVDMNVITGSGRTLEWFLGGD